MNLLETINNFIREHTRDNTICHNIRNKYQKNKENVIQVKESIIQVKESIILPLSNKKIEFIKSNNKCYNCDNIANYIADIDNRKINFCWKHSYLYSHE